LAIHSIHTRQSTLPFNISQLAQNVDESSLKHFIEHIVGARENLEF